MKKTNLAIAGATGTNGRELLRQLAARRTPARALVRDLDKAANLAGEFVDLVRSDLTDPGSLAEAFEGIETAYIVTAVHRDAEQWFDNFFAAANDAGVRRVVKFSGMHADPDSPSEIIRQHGRSDAALRESGLTYTIVRPNSFFQNIFWQADSIRATGQFFLPAGDAKQSQVDVRDLAEATANILTESGHDNKIYDLTGPEAISYFDVADTLSDVLGKRVTYVPVPEASAKDAMLQSGMPEWDANALAEIQTLFATGIYGDVTNDLERLLGREPRRFADFARDFATAFN